MSLLRRIHLLADTRLVHITDQCIPPLLILQYIPHPSLQPFGIAPEAPASLEAEPVYERRLPMSHKDRPVVLLFACLSQPLPVSLQQLLLAFLHG